MADPTAKERNTLCPDGERCKHGCTVPACFRYPVGKSRTPSTDRASFEQPDVDAAYRIWPDPHDARQGDLRYGYLRACYDMRLRSAPEPRGEQEDYKMLWVRDSTALGKALQQLSTARAIAEDYRAALTTAQGELEDLRRAPEPADEQFNKADTEALCAIAVAGATQHQEKTISGLCDRLDRISRICHDPSIHYSDKLRQIGDWSAGFMPLPPTPETKGAELRDCICSDPENCREPVPGRRCKAGLSVNGSGEQA